MVLIKEFASLIFKTCTRILNLKTKETINICPIVPLSVDGQLTNLHVS